MAAGDSSDAPPATKTEKAPKLAEAGAKQDEVPAAARGFGHRHLHLLLMSVGLGLAYACRINLSVCVVAMTSGDGSNGYQVFDWDQRQRGLVLSSFFWGYVLMQVPGATLANRFGPCIVLLVGVAGCGVLTIVSPLAAAWGGWRLMCAIRVAEGLCQGVIFPCSHYMMGRWVPPVERGGASAMIFGGPSVGTLAAMAGVGLLCGSPLGWPSGFYVPGGLSVLWGVAWWKLGADTPSLCKHMPQAERDYIQASLGESSSSEKNLHVPWGPMLRAPCTWAVIAAHICGNFGHWLMLTQMPNYMKTMLHFDIKDNGLVSSLPYLSLAFTSLLVGWLSGIVNGSGRLSTVVSRKIFNSISHYGMACTFLVLSLLSPRSIPVSAVIALLTLAVSLEAFILAGFLVNHVDLTPNFGGAMLGITNGLGNTMGIVAPILVSFIVNEAPGVTEEELAASWSRVFLIGSCVYFSGNTVFLVLGRADVQPWNEPRAAATASNANGSLRKDSIKGSKGDPAEEIELLPKQV